MTGPRTRTVGSVVAAACVWSAYLLVPADGWGLFHGRPLGLLPIIALAAVWWLAHTVCVPIDPHTPGSSTLDRRAEQQLRERGFQRRDGQWYQCKPWISRRMFFRPNTTRTFSENGDFSK